MEEKKNVRLENILISNHQTDSLFSDVYIEHNSFPEMDFSEIDTSVEFFGKKVPFPMIINAITGGTEQGVEINEILYTISKELNIPMEIGNQDIIFEDEKSIELFLGEHASETRETVMLANLHASSSLEDVKKAIESIKADGIALHINPAQEIIGPDGRRDFRGILDNIKAINEVYPDRLIIKEIGSGMSRKTVESIISTGVNMIDVSGLGGSNLIEIENLRNVDRDFSDLYDWGIPTAKSILDARAASKDLKIIASGGIKTSVDLVKALILGADYVGIGGELLKFLLHGGHEYAKAYLEELIYKTKVLMFLLGVKNIEELKRVPYQLTGKLKELYHE
ncbi:MAG: type 2 isopentenyl-diphosphate Delta-isomerase [Tissierellia bacterium]|nr:type 2 isopentenyl-diphosphate Delta-isomerase [Tissierellia bacterium]